MTTRRIAGSLCAAALFVAAPAHGGQFDKRHSCVAPISDLDGDGAGDVLVANRASGPRECVWAVSAKTGRVLYRIEGRVAGDLFGCALAELGDVDKDGVSDFVVGGLGKHMESFAERGGAWDSRVVGRSYVRIVSGKTGATVREIEAPSDREELGVSVCSAGDVDGDGVPDVLAGNTSKWSQFLPDVPPLSRSVVHVFSAATGEKIRLVEAPEPGTWSFGWSVALTGDLDGDTRLDWAVGAPAYRPAELRKPKDGSYSQECGIVYLVSSKDGSKLRSLRIDWEQDFGTTLAALPLPDGKTGLLAVGSLSKSVHVFDLSSDKVVTKAETHSPWDIDAFGSSLALVRDGGKPLLVVGANEQAPEGFFDVGYADLIRSDGTQARALMPHDRTQGVDATAIGDFDGDQRPDYACVLVNDMHLVLIGSAEKTARREVALLEPAASKK